MKLHQPKKIGFWSKIKYKVGSFGISLALNPKWLKTYFYLGVIAISLILVFFESWLIYLGLYVNNEYFLLVITSFLFLVIPFYFAAKRIYKLKELPLILEGKNIKDIVDSFDPFKGKKKKSMKEAFSDIYQKIK